MKFYFDRVGLWRRNGDTRSLSFLPNRVNVITGDSNTGKTAILEIVDYCLLASTSKISESVINENVSWYGISFSINDKKYTIARKSLVKGVVSDSYYFSSSGEWPTNPTVNSDERTLRSILEAEFGITSHVEVPYGGRYISQGSKISFRYFLLLTTISQDVITNSRVFFDKQDEDRYREALPRMFDIAVGIDTLSNILNRERRELLLGEIRAIERKLERLATKKNEFNAEIGELASQAKGYGLLEPDIRADEAYTALDKLVRTTSRALIDKTSGAFGELKQKEYLLNRQLRNLSQLKSEYGSYKKNLEGFEDSLKPIEYLKSRSKDIVKTSIYADILAVLEEDLRTIRSDIKARTPIATDIDEIIERYRSDLTHVRGELKNHAAEATSFEGHEEMLMFLGELKAKLELYGDLPPSVDTDGLSKSVKQLTEEIESLTVLDISESRNLFEKFLEEMLQSYMRFLSTALENYQSYLPVFDYQRKVLLLRKPMSDFIENVGSSSNHMFLHLMLFLGLHEAILRKDVGFVPSYLIIDQPSRPYWGDGDNRRKELIHSDTAKVRKAFELLNDFITRMNRDVKRDFQMIVFEHVPESTWTGLDNVHLVETFVDGNALVRNPASN